MIIRIELPWPDPILSPNRREHTLQKQASKRRERDYAYYQAIRNRPRCGNIEGNLELNIILYPPDKRHRDVDNIFASLKPAIDGVCKGLEIDDSQFTDIYIAKRGIRNPGVVKLEIDKVKETGSQ